MSSTGELYIEEVEDIFLEELDKAFGKGNWKLSHKGYCNLWEVEDFPDECEIVVEDKEGEKIGTAFVQNRFYTEANDLGQKYIQIEPESTTIEKEEK